LNVKTTRQAPEELQALTHHVPYKDDSVYLECPLCDKGGNTLSLLNTGRSVLFNCFRCGKPTFPLFADVGKTIWTTTERKVQQAKHIPQDLVPMVRDDKAIPNEAWQWLHKAQLKQEEIDKYKFKWSAIRNRVFYPIDYIQHLPTTWNARSIYKEIKPKYVLYRTTSDVAEFYDCRSRYTGTLVLVEDQLSAIRIARVTDCVSVLGTNINKSILLNLIKDYDTIVGWFDGDEAGRKAQRNVSKMLMMVTEVYNVYTLEDPKMLSDRRIRDELSKYLEQSKRLRT